MPRSAVYEFAARELGGDVEIYEATVPTSTTASEVVGGDAERVVLVMVNLGAAAIYVAPTPQVGATRGIYLGANGGSLTLHVRDDFALLIPAWHAVAAAGNPNLYVMRVRRFRVSDKETS